MLSLYEERKPIDLVTLTSLLKKRKKYTEVGGEFIANLVNRVPTAANISSYSLIIKEKSTKRSLITMSSNISTLCFEDNKELTDILNSAESSIFSIAQGN